MKQHLIAFCLFIDRYDITKFRSKILNTSSDIAETIHKFYLFFHFKISRDHPHPSIFLAYISRKPPTCIYQIGSVKPNYWFIWGFINCLPFLSFHEALLFKKDLRYKRLICRYHDQTKHIWTSFLELFFFNKKMELSHPKKSEL